MRVKELIVFLLVSISLLLISYYLHQFIIDNSDVDFNNKLLKSYLVSSSLLIVGSFLFFLIASKMKDRLGFLFLFWVIAKFMITYKLLYSDFKSDGIVTKPELLAIVSPYLLALICVTFYASRLLNKPEVK